MSMTTLDMFGWNRSHVAQAEESETDACSLVGANRLKAQIEDYWRAQGKDILVWVALSQARAVRGDRASIWMVKSHSINGIPQ